MGCSVELNGGCSTKTYLCCVERILGILLIKRTLDIVEDYYFKHSRNAVQKSLKKINVMSQTFVNDRWMNVPVYKSKARKLAWSLQAGTDN